MPGGAALLPGRQQRALLPEEPVWGMHCLWVYGLALTLLVFAVVYTEGEPHASCLGGGAGAECHA